MIDQIQLKNVKAWRESGAVTLAPVTMLLGTNSSGKSTLLQSLLLLKQTVASPDRTIHLNLGGDEAHDFFNFGDFDNAIDLSGAKRRPFARGCASSSTIREYAPLSRRIARKRRATVERVNS